MEINRKNKLLAGLFLAVAILLGRLFYIQIVTDKFRKSSENNSIVYNYIYPPRGVIYDRNGEVLVGNKICYDILVNPRDVKTFDTLTLAQVLGVSPEYIKDKFNYYRKYKTKIGFRSQVLVKQLPVDLYTRFAEEEYKFPGFSAKLRNIRQYNFNAGGNLLGYISEVSPEYIAKHPDEYQSGDYIGRTGIESAREKDLRGEKGYNIFLRNSRNIVKDPYNNGADDKAAIPGNDIVTTIDGHLQQYGQKLMEGKVGSVVAIEPSSGEILAMVSSPGIDVDILADIGSHYAEISKNKYKPLFNRTVMASYPPGSVFKLVNGLIGLQEGVLSTGTRYPCSQGYVYTSSGKKLGCHAHRSPLDLNEAIMMSCNGYFCYVLKSILENKKYENTEEAFNNWRDMVMSFGFGHKLGSDFPSELGGNIPSAKFYNRRYGKKHWRFQTIVSLSIGQGEIGATPLQIANLAAIMANRGYYYIPHIVKDSDNVTIDDRFRERNYTLVDTTQFQKVIQGMWWAVNATPGSGNTASIAAVPGLDICGKTGTAQNPHGKDNSVFICFAPRENPRIAIAVYVENAGFGATWASPIASLMIEKYLTGTVGESRKDLEKRIVSTHFIHQ